MISRCLPDANITWNDEIFLQNGKTTHLRRLSNALGSSSGIWIGVPFFDQGSRSMASNTGYWHSTSMCAGNLQHSGSPTKNMTSLPASLLYKFLHLKRTNCIYITTASMMANVVRSVLLYLLRHHIIFNVTY